MRVWEEAAACLRAYCVLDRWTLTVSIVISFDIVLRTTIEITKSNMQISFIQNKAAHNAHSPSFLLHFLLLLYTYILP